MRLLLLSDRENASLWDYYTPGKLDGIDLILSCGDLKADYLSFLVTMGRAPVLYVRGNHDSGYERHPPEGCDCVEDTLTVCKGLRILGLGGCPIYSGGSDQYTEKEMTRRLRRVKRQIRKAGGVDILLTHAPAAGWGDGDDYAHRGFALFNEIIDTYHPRYHIHGHVHMNYGRDVPRLMQHGETTVINAWDRYILDIDP